MNFQLRPANESELPLLNRFQQGIIEAEAPFIPRRRATPYEYYDLAQLLTCPDTLVAVAEVDGRIVASGYVQKRPAKHYLDHDFHGYIGFIYTQPDFRGQGIAGKILDYLAQWAKSQGLDELVLEVFADNQAALSAYERAGFSANLVEMRYSLK